MTDTLSDLPSLDMGAVPALWDAPAPSSAARNAVVGLPDGLRCSRRATKRQMLDLSRVANAAAHLERLPEPGESIHAVMRGNFDAWDLVPAVLRLASPATIGYLGVATLGFNARGTADLCRLMDAGSIRQVDFIASTYFQAKDAAEWAGLHSQLTARGGRCVAVRSHAKLLLFEMSDGAAYVIESSANLRSCRMAEQFCLTRDRGLFDFHRSWINTFIREAKK